jgi:hypothetical protein
MSDPTTGWDKAIGDEVLSRSTFTRNVVQQFLLITRDRVELVLLKFQDALKSRADWHAPAGTFATLLASLVAAQFRDALGMPSSVWHALFVLATVLCGVWLAVTLIRAHRSRRVTIDAVIDQLWKEGTPQESSGRDVA